MKYLRLFMLAGLFLFFYGCEELTGPFVLPEEEPVDFRDASEVVKPMKLWFVAKSDPELGRTPCAGGAAAHAGGWIEGHATHMGNFDQDSWWKTNACTFDPVKKELTNYMYMEPMAANGDALWIEITATVVLSDEFQPIGVKEGGGTIMGGTGRFEGATGSFPTSDPDVVIPITPEGKSEIFMEGSITLPKGN